MHNSQFTCSSKKAKTGQIIRIEQQQLNKPLDKVVESTVERTLNALLDAEADRLCGAARYERTYGPQSYARRALHGQFRDIGRQLVFPGPGSLPYTPPAFTAREYTSASSCIRSPIPKW